MARVEPCQVILPFCSWVPYWYPSKAFLIVELELVGRKVDAIKLKRNSLTEQTSKWEHLTKIWCKRSSPLEVGLSVSLLSTKSKKISEDARPTISYANPRWSCLLRARDLLETCGLWLEKRTESASSRVSKSSASGRSLIRLQSFAVVHKFWEGRTIDFTSSQSERLEQILHLPSEYDG